MSVEQQLAAGLASWLTGELAKHGASYGGDESIAQYLLSIEGDDDLAAYIQSFLGDTREISELSAELIRRRKALGGPAAAAAAARAAPASPEPAQASPAVGGFYLKKQDEPAPAPAPAKKKGKEKQPAGEAGAAAQQQQQAAQGLTQEDVDKARQGLAPQERSRFGGIVVSKGRAGKGKTVDPAELAQRGLLLPGRRRCDCMATRHRLVGNCITCGKIVCEQEGEGTCLFCVELQAAAAGGPEAAAAAVAAAAAEGQKKGKKSAGKGDLRATAFMQTDPRRSEPKRVAGKGASTDPQAGEEARLERALAQKNKLVEFDRTAAQRTVIIDDQTDWYDTRWMSAAERDASLAAAAEEKARAEEAARRGRSTRLAIDLAGRRARVLLDDEAEALEAAQAGEDGAGGPAQPAPRGEDLVRTVTRGAGTDAASARLRQAPLKEGAGTGLFRNPFLAVAAPRFVSSTPKPEAAKKKESKEEGALAAKAAAFREGQRELSRGMATVRAFDENARRVLERVQHDEMIASARPPAIEDLEAEPEELALASGADEDADFWGAEPRIRIAPQKANVRQNEEDGPGMTEDGPCVGRRPAAAAAAADSGAALSMHQPWASLLVLGIKRVEGRGWPTPHRGTLWIASTVKEADPEEVRDVEGYYSALARRAGRPPPAFPEAYPSGVLLGCVDVTDCLSHEQWTARLEAGDCASWPEENDSRYVFVCERRRRLPVPFPVRGQHKIWRLDPKSWETAKRAAAGLG